MLSNDSKNVISVTRAIGDIDWKKKKDTDLNLLTAVPEQYEGKFNNGDLFILACDGLVRPFSLRKKKL